MGVGAEIRVGFRDSVGVQSGQKFPLGGWGAHGASGAVGARGLLRAVPLATNCWRETPRGGLVWFGSTPPQDNHAHGQRNRPYTTELGWALTAIAVSRRVRLLTAPEPRGGTHGREIPPCLCVWRARCWGAFGFGGGGGRLVV